MKVFKNIVSFFLLVALGFFLNSCGSASSSSSKKKQTQIDAKLNKVYKEKLIAYKTVCNFRMAKLQRKGKYDTIIPSLAHQKDRIEFLKLIVETNYYNLELKSDYVASAGPRNLLKLDNYTIEISDKQYKYGKNKNRKYCDEDIVLLSKDFNEKWPPQKVPSNSEELYQYLFYKAEMIEYLIQNKCF
jgi:hypothetical protein